jgi:transglutaminase-like putative cysteine protease
VRDNDAVISLAPFLATTSVIDWDEPAVSAHARRLSRGPDRQTETARACFEWVRDHIPHTSDFKLNPITCSASEVLKQGTGFCYAKSHLLAALLRANRIPSGLVYQRLALDENGRTFCLHGLNAVWLEGIGWYRIDARGNRDGLRAQFDPPREVLPFACTVAGEHLCSAILADPLPVVVEALRTCRTRAELERCLPDAALADQDRPTS